MNSAIHDARRRTPSRSAAILVRKYGMTTNRIRKAGMNIGMEGTFIGCDQINRPSSCAHVTGSLAFFLRLQEAHDPTMLRTEWAPPLARGVTWSICAPFLMEAPHQEHLNFCLFNIANKSFAETRSTIDDVFNDLRLLLHALDISGFSFLYALARAFFCSPVESHERTFCAFTFSRFLERQSWSLARSYARFLFSVAHSVAQSTHWLLDVYLSDRWPFLQTSPVKYLEAPASFARLLVYCERFWIKFRAAISDALTFVWSEAARALPGAMSPRFSTLLAVPKQSTIGGVV